MGRMGARRPDSMSHPPLKRLFATGRLAQMAVARRDGAIRWAEELEGQRGILVFDDQQAAAERAADLQGWPFVVVEFERRVIEVDLLERVANAVPHYSGRYRAWLYPQEIWFDRAWWHVYRQEAQASPFMPEWLQPAEVTSITTTQPTQPDGGLAVGGWISIPTK